MKAAVLSSTLAICALADENLIEVYANRVFLHQSFMDQKSSFSLNLPEPVTLNDIDVSASCEVRSLKLNEREIVKDDDYVEVEKAKKELVRLKNKLSALSSKSKFLSDFSLGKEVQDIAVLKDNSGKFYNLMLENFSEISAIEEAMNDLNSKIQKYSPKYFVRLDLSFECGPKFVKVSYPVNVDLRLQNKILADTANKKINIIQGLVVKNPLSQDLNNLTIALYPFAYSSNLSPSHFYPWYEGKDEPMLEVAAAPMANEAYDMASAKFGRSAKEVQGQNFQSTLSNSWRIKNVNLKSNEEGSFVYDKQNLDAKFDIFIDGYGASNAYVRAKFTPLKSVEYADTTIKIDGVNIAKTQGIKVLPSEENSIFFGKNDLISVKKEKINDFTKESFFGNNSSTTEAYKYTVKNGSNLAWNVTLQERLPISTHEDIKVSTKNTPKENGIDREGRVSWDFELKANESKDIEFSYELTKVKK
ncbi:DUF4139 domain-containing protein [Campylobacter curvus]|uniref:DUF4139 domain-containing protein n=1 Tax=Campylobacter curvus TaxID=200 RepID=UPI00147070F1